MHLATNLQHLRARRKLSAREVALQLDIKRTNLSGYENGYAEPDIATLLRMANYWKMSTHRLLAQDLRTLGEFQLSTLERGYDNDAWTSHLQAVRSRN